MTSPPPPPTPPEEHDFGVSDKEYENRRRRDAEANRRHPSFGADLYNRKANEQPE